MMPAMSGLQVKAFASMLRNALKLRGCPVVKIMPQQ